mmetsp:Transcript_52493/g.131952  ORF Transcript_52493/g.131952 Transcript_52493/m.131952 type:complete len:286 (+) Transcript_52493:238-1095(+)
MQHHQPLVAAPISVGVPHLQPQADIIEVIPDGLAAVQPHEEGTLAGGGRHRHRGGGEDPDRDPVMRRYGRVAGRLLLDLHPLNLVRQSPVLVADLFLGLTAAGRRCRCRCLWSTLFPLWCSTTSRLDLRGSRAVVVIRKPVLDAHHSVAAGAGRKDLHRGRAAADRTHAGDSLARAVFCLVLLQCLVRGHGGRDSNAPPASAADDGLLRDGCRGSAALVVIRPSVNPAEELSASVAEEGQEVELLAVGERAVAAHVFLHGCAKSIRVVPPASTLSVPSNLRQALM